LTRAYCLTCNEQVDVVDGRCPEGHEVSTDDLGPQPWIGRALSAVGERTSQRPGAEHVEEPEQVMADELPATGMVEPAPGDEQPDGDSDELAALLADIDDGGPADLITDDEPSTWQAAAEEPSFDEAEDTSDELAALAEELALRAEPDPEEVAEPADDTLGALDDAMSAWDESDEQIVAPSEPVPDDSEPTIPPPPPPGTPAMASPPPPPPAPEDLFEPAPVTADEAMDMAAGDEPVDLAVPDETDDGDDDVGVEDLPPPAPEQHEPPRQIDLTNFTASGKRIDTSSTPRKRGLFGR
jgi:hypothetical protein